MFGANFKAIPTQAKRVKECESKHGEMAGFSASSHNTYLLPPTPSSSTCARMSFPPTPPQTQQNSASSITVEIENDIKRHERFYETGASL